MCYGGCSLKTDEVAHAIGTQPYSSLDVEGNQGQGQDNIHVAHVRASSIKMALSCVVITTASAGAVLSVNQIKHYRLIPTTMAFCKAMNISIYSLYVYSTCSAHEVQHDPDLPPAV